MNDGIKLIESCERLYLHQIEEPEPNSLRLVVVEAIRGTPYTRTDRSIHELQQIFRDAEPVIHEPGSKVFEISWPAYLGYAVRNESFVMEDASEVKTGRLFLEYSVSKYLDFIMAATFAGQDRRTPLRHFGICCMDHIIDVVSEDEPIARLVMLNSKPPAR
jgi:hypothetical protein